MPVILPEPLYLVTATARAELVAPLKKTVMTLLVGAETSEIVHTPPEIVPVFYD